MVYAVNMLVRPKAVTVSQISQNNVDAAMEIYLQNSIVCLQSVADRNPGIKPMLCVDFDLPEKYKRIYDEMGAVVEKVEFKLDVASKSNWSIVNYRYCVMGHLCDILREEDIVMMLDTDIICVDLLEDLLADVEEDILLYDVKHARSNQDRKNILLNYTKIYREESNLLHYGGEFICTRVRNLKKLHAACIRVIEASNAFDDLLNFNDEHITSIAVYRELKDKAHNSEAYIFRYWTGSFYLTSTNWKMNPVALWHLPVEKQTGICRVYRYYRKHRAFPDREKMARWFGFPKTKRPDLLRYRMKKIVRKIRKKLAK